MHILSQTSSYGRTAPRGFYGLKLLRRSRSCGFSTDTTPGSSSRNQFSRPRPTWEETSSWLPTTHHPSGKVTGKDLHVPGRRRGARAGQGPLSRKRRTRRGHDGRGRPPPARGAAPAAARPPRRPPPGALPRHVRGRGRAPPEPRTPLGPRRQAAPLGLRGPAPASAQTRSLRGGRSGPALPRAPGRPGQELRVPGGGTGGRVGAKAAPGTRGRESAVTRGGLTESRLRTPRPGGRTPPGLTSLGRCRRRCCPGPGASFPTRPSCRQSARRRLAPGGLGAASGRTGSVVRPAARDRAGGGAEPAPDYNAHNAPGRQPASPRSPGKRGPPRGGVLGAVLGRAGFPAPLQKPEFPEVPRLGGGRPSAGTLGPSGWERREGGERRLQLPGRRARSGRPRAPRSRPGRRLPPGLGLGLASGGGRPALHSRL